MSYMKNFFKFWLCVSSCFISFGNLMADPAIAPQTRVDSSGNIVAVWETIDSTIMTSSKPAGGSWTTPVMISGSGVNAILPRLVMNSSGNAVVVWQAFDDVVGDYCIQASMYPFGGTWSSPVRITNTSSDQMFSDETIQINEEGDIVVTWCSYLGTAHAFAILGTTATFGGSWTTPVMIYDPS